MFSLENIGRNTNLKLLNQDHLGFGTGECRDTSLPGFQGRPLKLKSPKGWGGRGFEEKEVP
jgi:hypothetical protein